VAPAKKKSDAGDKPAVKASKARKSAAGEGAAATSPAATPKKKAARPVKESAAAKPAKESDTAKKTAKESAAAKPVKKTKAANEEKTAKPARSRKRALAETAAASGTGAAIETDAASPANVNSANGASPSSGSAIVTRPTSGPPFPATEYAVVEKLLVGFLSHEVKKVGVTRAVLGLSGGVDSAVSAALAARALGPSNVLGVMMPYQSSSPESLADAYEVAGSLGIETAVVEITAQVDAYFSRYPDASRLRRGNKMARERMTILYDHSAATSALVVGTSNKTELLLGYGTLYGDMASALNPIGDLYKTQVWGLARHLALPAAVIEKAPTADLWSGQTDETELGFSYHEVDRLLFQMIDERCSTAELAELGFDPAFVERISQLVRRSQFKRRLPVIAKISSRSIDTDFRYSRDWGL
jgi:NAD+ synthase